MGQERWTTEQWMAITTKGCDLLVAAAAGSGKTAVLVERIIRLISQGEQPLNIDELLVVTFTNAAAAEMKERIGSSIQNMLELDPDNAHLQKQMVLLNRASITTIHSFCLEVIRENYMVVGIDPAFRVADEAEVKLMQSELLEELFEQMYSQENNEQFYDLVESYGENTGDKRLRELVLAIYQFIQASPFPQQWIEQMTEAFHIPLSVPLEKTFWGKLLREEVSFELRGILELNQLAMEITNTPDGPREYQDTLFSDRESIESLIGLLEKDFFSFYSALSTNPFIRLARKKKETSQELAEQIKALREEQKKGFIHIREKLFFLSPEQFLKDFRRLYPRLKALGNLVLQFAEKFQQAKLTKMIADFNDLEHYCLRILLEEESTQNNPIPSKFAKQLQSKYYEILTDEYQDSNFVQELILSVVSKNSIGQNNRFMVGDVKQSIYRFRLAKPELFMEKYNTYSINGTGKQRRIDLFQNFRSRDTILYGVNFLFRQLMSKELGEIEYNDKAALYPGADFKAPGKSVVYGGPIELDLIDLVKPEEPIYHDDDLSATLEEFSSLETEVNTIALRIQSLFQENFHVLDKQSGQYRPLQYRDIVILLRAPGSWNDIFTQIFNMHHIPSYSESSTGYFDSSEVMVMLSILQIIDNPRQDIALLSVLRSPIYSMTADEMLEIRLLGAKDDYFDCMVEYLKDGKEYSVLEKLERFFENLEDWRNKSIQIPIDELLYYIYEKTGYYEYIGVTGGGAVRQANLTALAQKAAQYEKTSYKGLFHFIQYIDKLQKNQMDDGAAKILSENENLVKIMSIHKSKGLEFPVVFVSGLGKKFNQTDTTKSVLLHQDLGIGTNYIDYENRVIYSTLSKAVIAKRIKKENLSEELRILYVAMTRAKEKLILTGSIRNLEKALTKWSLFTNYKQILLPHYSMSNVSTFLDWIVPAVLRHKNGQQLRDIAGIMGLCQTNGLYDDDSSWDVRVINHQQLMMQMQEESTQKINIKEELTHWNDSMDRSGYRDKIYQNLSWTYPYQDSVELPFHISISEMKRKNQRELILNEEQSQDLLPSQKEYELPEFLQSEKKLNAAQRGTVLHTVMEHLNFDCEQTKDSISKVLELLKREGILTQEEMSVVPVEKISCFFSSPLGLRIRAAKKIYKEMPFVLPFRQDEIYPLFSDIKEIETILVHGIIDCYFLEGDEIVLLDYKTDYIKEQMEEVLLQRYQLQMSIYKKALETITNKHVKEVYLYLFSLDKEVLLPI